MGAAAAKGPRSPAPRYGVASYAGANAFLERAESWLLQREDVHNLVLSLCYARALADVDEEPDVFYATVDDGEEIVGCIMRTPPHKVLVTDIPVDAAPAVADALAARYDAVPAVLGPEPVARAVARAWVERTGGVWRPGMRQRLYRLDEVRAPDGVPGRMRLAGSEDLDLAVEWGHAFADEAGIPFPSPRPSVSRWIQAGALVVWEVDGEQRSIAVASGRTPHGVRVGYVYTPPEHRRSGYASACVAALSRRLLYEDGYDFCVLYTDLENPTSNSIYTRVGYRPVEDVRDIDIIES
jgi:GNAT superfamily N-acetyltransferase